MSRRQFVRRPLLPRASIYKPLSEWPPVNVSFYGAYRRWLLDSGYSPSALNQYGCATRLVFSVLAGKFYWHIDLEADLKTVRDYIREHFTSAATVEAYFKGVAKLEQYLRRKLHEPKPAKSIHWEYYLNGLPEVWAEGVRAYISSIRRRWPPERQAERINPVLSHLTLWLRWLAAHTQLKNLGELTPVQWFEYLDGRLADDILPTTLNCELMAVQGWLRFLEGQGEQVCLRMFLVKPLPEGDSLPLDIPIEQVRALLQSIEAEAGASHAGVRRRGLTDRAWFLLMLHSGLRTGEIRRLRLADFEWSAQRVRIEQSKGLNDRLVPLSEAALDAVKAYLEVRGPTEALPEELFIFRHEPLSISYCYERLETYGKSLGIKVTPHQLRHTAATLLLNAGAPILAVQAILGHKFVDTTLEYARLYDGTVAADYYKAMAQVERCLALPEDGAKSMLSHDELLALIESLQTEALSDGQTKVVQQLKAGIGALATQEKMLALVRGDALGRVNH